MRATTVSLCCIFTLACVTHRTHGQVTYLPGQTLPTGPIKNALLPDRILVEGYWVCLTKDTVIVFSDARKAKASDLKLAQKVSCRSTSEIRLKEPPEIDAAEIVIHVEKKEANASESVTGAVTEVRAKGMPIKGATKDVIANILVDEHSVHITKETFIVFSDARTATIADLKAGKRVSVRIASDIAETDPQQFWTDVVVIQVGVMPDSKKD